MKNFHEFLTEAVQTIDQAYPNASKEPTFNQVHEAYRKAFDDLASVSRTVEYFENNASKVEVYYRMLKNIKFMYDDINKKYNAYRGKP